MAHNASQLKAQLEQAQVSEFDAVMQLAQWLSKTDFESRRDAIAILKEHPRELVYYALSSALNNSDPLFRSDTYKLDFLNGLRRHFQLTSPSENMPTVNAKRALRNSSASPEVIAPSDELSVNLLTVLFGFCGMKTLFAAMFVNKRWCSAALKVIAQRQHQHSCPYIVTDYKFSESEYFLNSQILCNNLTLFEKRTQPNMWRISFRAKKPESGLYIQRCILTNLAHIAFLEETLNSQLTRGYLPRVQFFNRVSTKPGKSDCLGLDEIAEHYGATIQTSRTHLQQKGINQPCLLPRSPKTLYVVAGYVPSGYTKCKGSGRVEHGNLSVTAEEIHLATQSMYADIARAEVRGKIFENQRYCMPQHFTKDHNRVYDYLLRREDTIGIPLNDFSSDIYLSGWRPNDLEQEYPTTNQLFFAFESLEDAVKYARFIGYCPCDTGGKATSYYPLVLKATYLPSNSTHAMLPVRVNVPNHGGFIQEEKGNRFIKVNMTMVHPRELTIQQVHLLSRHDEVIQPYEEYVPGSADHKPGCTIS